MFKIALVGCGGMAVHYRRRYTEIPGAELAVVIDSQAEVACSCAEELGVAVWGTDFRLALGEEISMVDVSTPNFLHCEQVMAALQAGKHVLVQKPIAPTVAEAEAMVAAARETGRQLGMYMSMFDNPLFYEIKEMLQAGALGTISSARCRGAHRGGLSLPPGTWRGSREKTGGGSFIQLAIHPLNMVQWLLETEVVRVAGFSKNMLSPHVGGDDITTAACAFASGALGLLDAAYCADPSLLEIYGTRGFLSVQDETRLRLKLDAPYTGRLIKHPGAGKVLDLDMGEEIQAILQGDNPYDQHQAFVRAMLAGKPAPIPGEIGLRDLRIVQAVYQAAAEGRVVEVEQS